MLVVNAFSASAHAVLISMLVDSDKAMLAAVLMLVFMNLAASVHPKLGEASDDWLLVIVDVCCCCCSCCCCCC